MGPMGSIYRWNIVKGIVIRKCIFEFFWVNNSVNS